MLVYWQVIEQNVSSSLKSLHHLEKIFLWTRKEIQDWIRYITSEFLKSGVGP
jgi:hypothetical protein